VYASHARYIAQVKGDGNGIPDSQLLVAKGASMESLDPGSYAAYYIDPTSNRLSRYIFCTAYQRALLQRLGQELIMDTTHDTNR
jgi:hypothetical protein